MAKSITYVGLDVRRYILGHIGPHNIAIHEQPSHLQRLRYRRRRFTWPAQSAGMAPEAF